MNMSASYLDLQLEIDNESQLQTKHYEKSDNISVPTVKFPFLFSNINTAAPTFGVYIFRYTN